MVDKIMETKVQTLIKKLTRGKPVEYWQVLENIYGEQVLLSEEAEAKVVGLSEGISDYKAFDEYLNAIVYDIQSHAHYRNYALPLGDRAVRDALARFESVKFEDTFSYTIDSFCVTEGATGAVSSIFEYIHKKYPQGEILSHSPNYYLFKYSARHLGIPFKEIPIALNNASETIPVDTLLAAITSKTKLIVISNPHNPTGSTYAKDDLMSVIKAAKNHNILVLIDEIFNDILFDKNDFVESDEIAHKLDAGENIIVVKGYSKSKNLPGFRIGYAFSENIDLIKGLGDIQEARVNFATGSNYLSLIIVDSLYSSIARLHVSHPKTALKELIKKAKKIFGNISLVDDYNEDLLMRDYTKFVAYNEKLLDYYRQNYENVITLMTPYLENKANTKCGFNTFLKFKDMEGVNMFDFCLNLYLQTGVMIHAAPYFGFDQKAWENDKDLGFWFRITFALEPKKMDRGIKKLLKFREAYLQGKGKFIKTGLQF
jgi:aspartate/methionine/tyrosine aminotransferase